MMPDNYSQWELCAVAAENRYRKIQRYILGEIITVMTVWRTAEFILRIRRCNEWKIRYYRQMR